MDLPGAAMGEVPLQKISMSGPTFASLIQRFCSAPGPIEGLLFGHVSVPSPPALSDDDPTPTSTTVVATITSFLPLSFYDSTGSVQPERLATPTSSSSSLIGWFSGRRKSHLRPSMREFSVSSSLSSSPSNFTPRVFLLLASPIPDTPVHTHEYRAYEFRSLTHSFEARSMDIVNIGPHFRLHYSSFTPISPFPFLPSHFPGDHDDSQRSVDAFDLGGFDRLLGSDATAYTSAVEDLYGKMLLKIQNLATQVEISSAKVLDQENHNRKLRYKIFKSPVPE